MTSSYILINSLRIHYQLWNHAGELPAVVCHHGLASSARIWDLTAPYLAQAGFPVYALDARGHGRTDKPDEGYDIETMTGDLAAFVEACHLERPLLVGHSWGAFIALNYAARFAIGPRAPAGIVLVDGGMNQMNDLGMSWEEMERRLTPPNLAGMTVETFLENLRHWNASWEPTEEALNIFLANFDISDDDRIYPRLALHRHMGIVRSIWDFETFKYYPRLRCPVLMIPAISPERQADPDFLAARERGLKQARKHIRGVVIQPMPDTIHDIPLQRPVDLASIIVDFVRTQVESV